MPALYEQREGHAVLRWTSTSQDPVMIESRHSRTRAEFKRPTQKSAIGPTAPTFVIKRWGQLGCNLAMIGVGEHAAVTSGQHEESSRVVECDHMPLCGESSAVRRV